MKYAAALLSALLASTSPAVGPRWTLAHARAYLVAHELRLVDRTQADRPEFDVRFTRASAASLVREGGSDFRYDGRALDVFRGTLIHLRFELHPQTNGATIAHVHGPLPNRAQPSFPIRATFYYGWFPEAWDQEHVDPFSVFHPSLGFYDSSDPAILRTQIAAMRYGRLSAAIYSWWGEGTKTDDRFRLALALARQTPFRWAVYYEPEGYGDPTPAQIHGDLLYLKQHYFRQPAYLHVDGKPVVFAYGDGREDCSVAERWHAANQGIGAYVDLSAFGAREHVSFHPFVSGAGVHVAAGDVDGDGRPELIASSGSEVAVFRRDGTLITSFPSDPGASVAAADLDGDGRAEIVTGSATSGDVRVFDVADGRAVLRRVFDTGLQGARVAAGNREIVAAGEHGPGLVKVYNGTGSELSSFSAAPSGPVSVAVTGPMIVTAARGYVRFFADDGTPSYPSFEPYANYSGDVTVAVGDTNRDGYPDVITDGDGVPVRIFSLRGSEATQFAEFGAFDASVRGAVSLAAADTNGNGTDEVLAGSPVGGEVRLLYSFRDCAEQPDSWHVYDPAQAEVYLPPFEFGISPGFSRALVRPGDPFLVRDLTRWDENVVDMNQSGLPWHLVETFNEWGEGTAVESAREWATSSGYGAYLDALRSGG